MTDTKEKTGTLVYDGYHPLGLDSHHFSKCVDCDGIYPHLDGVIKCNGATITLCPYCRPDSEPFKNGRGL